jgi:drug/metabolite transporter (DMT)-like permease
VARPVAWAGFAISLGGVAVVAEGHGGGATGAGDALVLVSVLIASSLTVAQGRLLKGQNPVAVTAVQFLGAANAALPWPTEPLAVLWQAATVLRELRGDGHVLAQLSVGLDGLSTMVLRSGHDLHRDALQPHRGWTDEEWAAAGESLAKRGLLGLDGRITSAGRELLDRAEALTDELAQEPWTIAGSDTALRFAELAEPLARAARRELPEVNPIGLPRE